MSENDSKGYAFGWGPAWAPHVSVLERLVNALVADYPSRHLTTRRRLCESVGLTSEDRVALDRLTRLYRDQMEQAKTVHGADASCTQEGE